ncbi:MAG: hypothetical protein HS117_05940 [Verrucomicrobiaceae bacterium]|nr:hypothetical protein [Verrucomicrobiaceae bacterium]
MTFQEAVEKTTHLKDAYRPGLQALRAEDKPHIEAEDTRKLTGSVDVDTANLVSEPHSNRWDFGIAYQHTNRSGEVVYWVETHTASDSQVGVVIKKAAWLQQWFKGHGKHLALFEKDIVWVSSGATTFTLSSTQRKQMAALGLRPIGGKLRIRNKR